MSGYMDGEKREGITRRWGLSGGVELRDFERETIAGVKGD